MEPLDLTSIRAFVFDFDGVILESTGIKNAAFRELFADRPGDIPAILEHHQKNLGISRFEKFRWIHEKLFDEPLTNEKSQELGARFSALVLDQVRTCPLVPGALEVLQALDGDRPAFVASGTPQGELDVIVADRDLSQYFAEVWGSPRSKPSILESVRSRHGWSAEEMILVGDGESDYRAAQATGVRFLARALPGSREKWNDLRVAHVDDLTELLQRLP